MPDPSDPRSEDARLAAALRATATWDVPEVAAAVVDGSGARAGVRATVGDTERSFRLASVTKLFTAYACLIAVEEGTLELDEPAGPPGSTVRHLLAHAGGYGFNTQQVSPPGEKRIYSNTGIDVLGEHLATRSAMPADDYVTAAVFDPLGLSATDLREGSLAHGAWTTAADLARFATELLSPTLIHRSTLGLATTVQFPGLAGTLPGVGPQSPMDWGLGFELRDHKHPHWTGSRNSPSTFGHFGGSGTFLWVDPDAGRSLVVLTNREYGPWALDAWPRLSDAVLGVPVPTLPRPAQ